MNEEIEFKTKAAKYRHHVLKAQEFSGSLREYCRKFDLDAGYFYHCRCEMGLSNKVKTSNAFAKVVKPMENVEGEVEQTDMQSDAKWLAEFVHHYLNIQ